MVSKINELIVAEYSALMKDQEGVVVLTLEGLSVQEAEGLRASVRATGAELKLAKSRLAKVAIKANQIPIEDTAFVGSAALLVGSVDTTLAAAKAIEQLAASQQEERTIFFRGAWFDGTAMGEAEAASIPSMPDKHTLRGMMVGALSGSARMLATLMREVPASTARALSARAGQEDPA